MNTLVEWVYVAALMVKQWRRARRESAVNRIIRRGWHR